ncbi:MAG: hypothetical protein L0Y76_02635, partial [Ignavibacteria bacterium]|nr:hypothetical protein [Ignavibacteria bacterium]
NDVDFCKRISDSGFKIIFYPDAKVRHSTGVSIYKDRSAMIKHWNRDCLKYFRKHDYKLFPYFFLFIGLKVTGFFRILIQKLKHI